MQAIPDARQQSFEEIYGPPENFLEIEVCGSLVELSYPQTSLAPLVLLDWKFTDC
jgi:hypothetical protein